MQHDECYHVLWSYNKGVLEEASLGLGSTSLNVCSTPSAHRIAVYGKLVFGSDLASYERYYSVEPLTWRGLREDSN